MCQNGGGGTEREDLERDIELPDGLFTFVRDARLFARNHARLQRLEAQHRSVPLAPDQIFHPAIPVDAVVRKGKLRVSELLPDGREVTRAVLQAGAIFRTRPCEPVATPMEPASPYHLADIVLTSLGEGELWLLAAGVLDQDDSPS
jgi:hypothetical protein